MTGIGGLAQVATGVWVATATLYATTSTVVVDDDGAALVVDPGVTPGDLAALVAEVAFRGWRVVAGFSTHPHWDHLLWPEAFGDVPRWARARAVAAAADRRESLLAESSAALGTPEGGMLRTFGRLSPLPGDDGPIPGVPCRAIVVGHEGHAPGHAALFLPASRTLVAGDMLSDVEVPLLDCDARDPLGDYVTGLERLAALVEGGDVDVVVPGHGTVADAAEARCRLALDRAYLADLAAGRPSADPRLAAAPAWLREEHEAQVRALGGRGSAR